MLFLILYEIIKILIDLLCPILYSLGEKERNTNMEKEEKELSKKELEKVSGGTDTLVNFQFEIGEIVGYKKEQYEITDRRMQPLFGGVARLYTLRGVKSDEIVIDAKEQDLERIYLSKKDLEGVVGGTGEQMIYFKYEIGQVVFYNTDMVEITNRRVEVLCGGSVRLYEVKGVESNIVAAVEESKLKPVLK